MRGNATPVVHARAVTEVTHDGRVGQSTSESWPRSPPTAFVWIWQTRDSVTPEDLADLGEREPLEVVERDDDLLALRQRVDRGGQQPAGLLALDARRRVEVLVGERVDQRDLLAAVRPHRHQLVEGQHGDERDLASRRRAAREREMPSRSAISASVGCRFSMASRSECAFSISRALNRTERGTQSIARSSSMIAPLIRGIAYVSNLLPRPGSNFCSASISPNIAVATPGPPARRSRGDPVATRLATYFTSGA